MPISRVYAGQPLRIPVGAYNAFADAADAHADRARIERTAASRFRVAGIVDVINRTGGALTRNAILGIEGPGVSRATNESEYFERVLLAGNTYAPQHRAFCVLAETVLDGRIGRAVVDGYAQCRVLMADESHLSAGPTVGSTHWLTSGISGADLVWIEPPGERAIGNIAECIVRLGGGGAGGETFRCVLTGYNADRTRFVGNIVETGEVGVEVLADRIHSAPLDQMFPRWVPGFTFSVWRGDQGYRAYETFSGMC